jgi:HK97 family phage portal protein
MEASGVVFAIVSRIAESTASVTWGLEKPATSAKGEPTPVAKHPALDLLRTPNPFMSGRDLIESVQQHVELTGEGYFVVSRGTRTNLPMEMWPVRPDRMAPVPGTDGVFLRGWIYTGPAGEKIPLDVNDVIQIRKPNPSDPFGGLGPLAASMPDIQAAKMAAEWNRNFFVNSAQPGGIIEVEEGLSDTEWRQMVDRWREQHQGVGQAHRVAILEKGKWVDRNYTVKDMDFASLRQIPDEKVRQAFGFPKPMLGDVDDVNLANAKAAETVFGKWLLVPRLERIKAALDSRLLPMYGPLGEDLAFCYESPVPEDADAENAALSAKVTAYVALVGARVTPASASEVTGLPPMEHEEPEPVPAALAAPTVPDGTPAPGGHEADQEDVDEDQGIEQAPPKGKGKKAEASAAVRLRNATAPATLPQDAEPDVEPVQTAWETALEALLASWVAISAAQMDTLVDQVRRVVQYGDINGLQNLNVKTADGHAALTTAMVELATTAAQQVVDEADAQQVELDAKTPDRAHLAALAGIGAAVLGHQLALSACTAATRAWGATSTPDEVATAVRTHLDTLTDSQPRQVLGASLASAQHDGRLRTITAGPFAALYAAEHNDQNACISCREVDRMFLGNSDDLSQPWLAAYPSRGYVGCLGGDRCRGTVVAIWRDGSSWNVLISGAAA